MLAISAAFNGRWRTVSHQKCLFLSLNLFYFFFFSTDSVQWEGKLTHGWAVLNTNSSLECLRKNWIVLSHLKMTSKGKLFVTQWICLSLKPFIGSLMCYPGMVCSMSKSMGWQLLWWEGLASRLERKHQLGNGLKDVQSHTSCFTRQWIRDD